MGEEARTVIGARPARPVILEDEKGILKNFKYLSKEQKKEAAKAFAEYAAQQVKTGSNMRASAEYRTLLAKVLTKRAWGAVGGMADED